MIDLAGENIEELIFPNALLTTAVINNIEVMNKVGIITY